MDRKSLTKVHESLQGENPVCGGLTAISSRLLRGHPGMGRCPAKCMRERSFVLRKGGLGSQAKPEVNPRDTFDLDAETRLYRPDVPVTPPPQLCFWPL